MEYQGPATSILSRSILFKRCNAAPIGCGVMRRDVAALWPEETVTVPELNAVFPALTTLNDRASCGSGFPPIRLEMTGCRIPSRHRVTLRANSRADWISLQRKRP